MAAIWYRKDGSPIDMSNLAKGYTEVEKLLGDSSYKIIQQDYTPEKKYWVSTVWLGLDHSSAAFLSSETNPAPIIFETMVFAIADDGKKDMSGVFQQRYSTEEEAKAGHKEVLEGFTHQEQYDKK